MPPPPLGFAIEEMVRLLFVHEIALLEPSSMLLSSTQLRVPVMESSFTSVLLTRLQGAARVETNATHSANQEYVVATQFCPFARHVSPADVDICARFADKDTAVEFAGNGYRFMPAFHAPLKAVISASTVQRHGRDDHSAQTQAVLLETCDC
jgi:hypothetical protein